MKHLIIAMLFTILTYGVSTAIPSVSNCQFYNQ